MIELSTTAASVLLRGNQKRYVRIESWYGDQLLDDDLPVAGNSGSEEVDRSSNVPERVTLSVPRLVRGVNYTPTEQDSPLAANGQRLRVQLGIGVGPTIEWIPRGWFVIVEAEPRDDVVDVQAAGLLWLISEARLVSPYQPSGTFKSTLRGLLEPNLTVVFDAALVDRAVPGALNYDEDRLGAVNTTLAAWPAEGYVTEDGYYLISPAADAATVSLALTDGQGGTVIQATGTSTRDGAYNAVVARGTATDGGAVQGVASDYTGPKAIGSPFNEMPVPLYYESPLITTAAQAQAAANTRLANIKRQTSRTFEVTCVPHPALQGGDRVTLTTADLDAVPAIIEKLTLPYKPDGGSMALTVRTIE
jgi:hypothetical protein